MTGQEKWVSFSWYCSNCGTIVTGYKSADGTIKVECKRCRTIMVRRTKGRRHDTIDLYAPKTQEHLHAI